MFGVYDALAISKNNRFQSPAGSKALFDYTMKISLEMRSIEINAVTISSLNKDRGGTERIFIFVPNAQVVETKYPGMPLTTQTDNKSRELMLAYLVQKGFIELDDPAIAETFPFNYEHVAKIDIDALLAKAKDSQPSPSSPQL